ncbi:hypothetical protein HKD37_18G051281 [Glycine soja]
MQATICCNASKQWRGSNGFLFMPTEPKNLMSNMPIFKNHTCPNQPRLSQVNKEKFVVRFFPDSNEQLHKLMRKLKQKIPFLHNIHPPTTSIIQTAVQQWLDNILIN